MNTNMQSIKHTVTLLVSLLIGISHGYTQDDITNMYAQKESIFVLRFKSTVDTITALDINRYNIDKSINVVRALIEDPEGRTIVLISDSSLIDTTYQVQVNGVKYHGELTDSVIAVLEIKVVDYDWWNVPSDTIDNVYHHAYWSNEHDRLVGYSIYLPPGYQGADSLPVEYFLGGLGSDENDMFPKIANNLTNALESGDIPPFIVVWPNPMALSWYLDEERYHVETMITKELIPVVDANYKTMKSVKGRWISGFSMGGFGSLNLGMRHTSLFSSVVSYAIARQPVVKNPEDVRNNLQIRMICGEEDSYYPMEYTNTYKLLQSLDIPVDYESVPGVPHSFGGLYNRGGVKGLKFHWRTLGGFNEKPVVDAGDDVISGFGAPVTVNLKGMVRDDHYPGTYLTHYWQKASGKGLVEFNDSTALNPVVSLHDTGYYELILSGSDGEFTVNDTLNIYVSPVSINMAPVVSTGRDIYLLYPDRSLKLSGTVSDDGLPEGSILTSWWSVQNGQGSVDFTDSMDIQTTVTFSTAGEYVLRLLCDDTEFRTSRDLHITVTYPGEIIPDVRWRFNEGEGDTVYNCAGIFYNGYLEYNPDRELQSGKEGDCLRFNGADNFVRIPVDENSVLFKDLFSTRTISLWFKTDNNKIGTHMMYDEGGRYNGISISKSGGFLSGAVSKDEQVILKTIFNYTMGWQHVALTYNQGEIKLYLNGEVKDQKTVSFSEMGVYAESPTMGATLNTSAFSVGAGDGMVSHYFDGYLDDVQIFNTVLPDNEIKKLAGIPVGQEEVPAILNSGITVYPNPCNEFLNLRLTGEERDVIEIYLFDLTGEKILQRHFYRTNLIRFEIPERIKGVYLLKVYCGNEVYTKKAVIY